MSRRFPWLAAVVAVGISVIFTLSVRLPLPFEGFAAVVAALLAGLSTLVFCLGAPARFLWSDTERLSHAFSLRHNVTGPRAAASLQAIAGAHGRADAIRAAAQDFAEPLKLRSELLADRIDGLAREMFYDPETIATHRTALVRTELIEQALETHAKLRRRTGEAQAAQLEDSRAKIGAALDALDEAFEAGTSRGADVLLEKIGTSSATAEMLLRRGKRRA